MIIININTHKRERENTMIIFMYIFFFHDLSQNPNELRGTPVEKGYYRVSEQTGGGQQGKWRRRGQLKKLSSAF
jgi:hypothetical protein